MGLPALVQGRAEAGVQLKKLGHPLELNQEAPRQTRTCFGLVKASSNSKILHGKAVDGSAHRSSTRRVESTSSKGNK